MKKLIISFVLVGLLIGFAPAVHAATQEELTQQLIVLLTNLIAQLQQQINDILAKQATQQVALDNIQSNTQQIAVNTTVPLPPPLPPPAELLKDLSVSCGGKVNLINPDVSYIEDINANSPVDFTVSASGGDGKYKYAWQILSANSCDSGGITNSGGNYQIDNSCYLNQSTVEWKLMNFGKDIKAYDSGYAGFPGTAQSLARVYVNSNGQIKSATCPLPLNF